MQKIQAGFTVIEILIVISIIGVLMTLAFSGFTSVQQDGRDLRRRDDIDTLNAAVQQYRSRHGSYPIASTFAEFSTILIDEGIISVAPTDPLNSGSHLYFYESDPDGRYYILWAVLENTDGPNTQYYRSNQSDTDVILVTPGLPTTGPSPVITRPYQLTITPVQ